MNRAIIIPAYALCLLATIATLIYMAFVLPHSGLDFADEGLTLYSSLSLVNHNFAFDWIALPRPSIVTSFFMLLGLRNILALKLAFVLTVVFVVTLLVMSLEKKLWMMIPIVLALEFYNAPLTIGSYENTPMLFLMLGLAFFFFAQNAQRFIRIGLLLLSAFFLAISAFTNISVLPAAIFTVLLMCIWDKKRSDVVFLLGFVLFLTLAIFWYVSVIGASNFQLLMTSHQSMALLKSFISKVKHIFPLYSFSKATHQLPRMALVILLFALYGVIASLKSKDNIIIKIRLIFVAGLSYYFCQAAVTDNPLLIPLSYYCGLFALVYVSLFYVCRDDALYQIHRGTKTVFYFSTVFLLGMGVYTQLNFSYGNGKTIDNTVELTQPLLRGLYVTPAKAVLIDSLYQVYTNNACNQKPFIAFYDLPILYYVFQRSAPLHQSWIESFSDKGGFPQSMASDDKILQWFNQNNNWCVFYSGGLVGKSGNEDMLNIFGVKSQHYIKLEYRGAKGAIWVESAPAKYVVFVK